MLRLCPPGACLLRSPADESSVACFNGRYSSAAAFWSPAVGTGALAGFLVAGFTTAVCPAISSKSTISRGETPPNS